MANVQFTAEIDMDLRNRIDAAAAENDSTVSERFERALQTARDQLTRDAGALAQTQALRGFDAIHLAIAPRFAELYDDLRFLAFDPRLNDAAIAESLMLFANPA